MTACPWCQEDGRCIHGQRLIIDHENGRDELQVFVPCLCPCHMLEAVEAAEES